MTSEKDGKKLMLFASLGLVNNALKRAFRELIMRLPDLAWPTEPLGRVAKAFSTEGDDCKRDMDRADLAWRGLREPTLYEGLTAVVLWDACYLKESFWNAAHPDFGRYANYVRMSEIVGARSRTMADRAPSTSPRLARGDLDGEMGDWSGLEAGVCEDFTPWLTEDLGFEPARVHRVRLFDWHLIAPDCS